MSSYTNSTSGHVFILVFSVYVEVEGRKQLYDKDIHPKKTYCKARLFSIPLYEEEEPKKRMIIIRWYYDISDLRRDVTLTRAQYVLRFISSSMSLNTDTVIVRKALVEKMGTNELVFSNHYDLVPARSLRGK